VDFWLENIPSGNPASNSEALASCLRRPVFSALCVGGMAKKILLAQRPLLENFDLIRREYFGG
jgi:hypothetical protein